MELGSLDRRVSPTWPPAPSVAHATDLALRTNYTETWRVGVGFLLVIYLPLVMVAWLKVGPVAGLVVTAWFLFVAFLRSQPGASLFGSGPYSAPSRPRSDKGPTDTEADPASGERQRGSGVDD